MAVAKACVFISKDPALFQHSFQHCVSHRCVSAYVFITVFQCFSICNQLCFSIVCFSISSSICVSASVFQHLCSASVFQHLCSSICVPAFCVQHLCFQHLCSSILCSSICVQHLCVPASVFQHLCSSICVVPASSVFQHLCSSICVPASVFQHLCVPASVFQHCVPAFCVFSFLFQHLLCVLHNQPIAINDNLDHLRHLCYSHISNNLPLWH
jgi:hypothetical protein